MHTRTHTAYKYYIWMCDYKYVINKFYIYIYIYKYIRLYIYTYMYIQCPILNERANIPKNIKEDTKNISDKTYI